LPGIRITCRDILRSDTASGGFDAMTATNIFDTAPVPHPSRLRLRRQRKLAALYEQKVMSAPAFGILTIENVWRMHGLRLTLGTRVQATIFGVAALQALTEPTPGVRYDARQYGPIGQAVPWVHAYLSDAGSKDAEPAVGLERAIVWGEACENLLRGAHRLYSRRARAANRLERWAADTHKAYPFLTKGLFWFLALIVSGVVGWALRSWLGGR